MIFLVDRVAMMGRLGCSVVLVDLELPDVRLTLIPAKAPCHESRFAGVWPRYELTLFSGKDIKNVLYDSQGTGGNLG